MQIKDARIILMLEDDPDQARFYLKALKEKFGSSAIERLSTEREFLDFLNEPTFTPQLVITGNWQLYDNDMANNQSYDKLAPFLSGIRCCQALLNSELKTVPVLMYSIFDWEDYQDRILEQLPTLASDKSKFRYLTKDFNPVNLIKAVEEFVELTN